MGDPIIQTNFVTGELCPALWGRTDLDKYHSAAAVMRNFFVDYRSGATSRPGTAFCGFAGNNGQGLAPPPRLIPFQYSATETYVIEMGAGYFRFLFQGAYLTEAAQAISGFTNAVQGAFTVPAPINSGSLVFISNATGLDYPGTTHSAINNRFFYVSGDVLLDPATGQVLNTSALSAFGAAEIAVVYTIANPYAAADLRRIKYCQSGDTMTLTHISYPAAYLTRNTPSTWQYTPVTFAAVIQPPTNLALNAVGNGPGQGYAYHYTVTSVNDVTKEESTQSGVVGVVSLLLETTSSNGNVPTNILTWRGATGATRYNVYKQPVTVANDATNNVLTIWGYAGQTQTTTWSDVNYAPDYSQSPPIHYNPFGGAGLASIAAPLFNEYGFEFLQAGADYTQGYFSSNYGSIAFAPDASPVTPFYFNQPTATLLGATGGGITQPQFVAGSQVNQPATVSIISPGDGLTAPSYEVQVSDAAPQGSGLVLVTPSLAFTQSSGGQFPFTLDVLSTNTNLVADGGSSYRSDGVLINPMIAAHGTFDATAAVNKALAEGRTLPGIPSGTTQVAGPYPACYFTGNLYFTVRNTAASSYPSGQASFNAAFVVQAGGITGIDLIQIAPNPDGSSFAGDINFIDPQHYEVVFNSIQPLEFYQQELANVQNFTADTNASTNYPGVCCYFQQRAVFAGTSQEPQGVYMSKPGLFQNMDYSVPSEPDDSINITINAQDLSIIQSATPMPSGLILLTGEGAWQITGGGLFQPVTPSSINAQPQAFSGASYLQPLRINYDLLYVQARGYAVRRLQYNFYFNVYAGTDISVLSAHLFEGRQLVEWCYAEQPFYLVWALRDDGVLLTLTYLAEQAVEGWARHDTQGYFQSIASVPEGSQDAVYVIVRRCAVIGGVPNYFYTTERFASRLLGSNLAQAVPGEVENAWCVDAGVQVAPAPGAGDLFITLTGAGALADVSVVLGGQDYPSSIIATVVDQTGAGSGAAVEVTVTAGVVTGIAVTSAGAGYVSPLIVLAPSTGSGAVFQAFAQSTCTLSSDQPAFGLVGQIVRASGGKAQITAVTSATLATAAILQPFTAFLPSTPQVAPAFAGTWTIGTPVSQITGLDHLEGQSVTGLADGVPIGPVTVANGVIPLATPASIVTVGLPYTCQLQTLPLDVPGGATVQGKRKFISAATLRVTETQGLTVGTSWARMTPIKASGFNGQGPQFATGGGIQAQPFNGLYGQNPVRYVDERILLGPNWGPNGQICIQQSNPLPASIVAIIPEVTMGDVPA